MTLANKKALVTGSSRGIGKAIVQRFLTEGCEVYGLCTKPSAAREELTMLARENDTLFHELYADASDLNALTEAVKQALAEAGGFDVLVNNAGITRDTLSFRMSIEDWNAVLAVNLTAVFAVSQIVSSDMIRKRKGSIINMTSFVGLHGQAGQANYSASKAGLVGFTKSLAKETGSRNIRVNGIAPGFIETDMTGAVDEAAKKMWLENIPLKRAGKPEEVADLALFLASDESQYITGQIIGIDGGMGA
ncbi:MAG: 3-oxoacyl-[acyl-carrier-protein] reductase [Treponemataceae bacterium]|nr:MAG: 3-oxoacyl-[acyl-carrier-protein] reductase [Treponemataceae bacterium]